MEHDREVHEYKTELNSRVPSEQYEKIEEELHNKQKEAEYLQKQLDNRMSQANKMVVGKFELCSIMCGCVFI